VPEPARRADPQAESAPDAPVRGRVVLAMAAVLFGAMAVSVRAVSAELSAPQITLARSLLGLAGVAVAAGTGLGTLRARRPLLLVLRGLLGGSAVLFYFLSLERLDAGIATLLNSCSPLFTALFAAWFLRERLGPRGVAGLVVATAGLGIVIGPGRVASALAAAGDARWRTGLAAGLASAVLAGASTMTVRAARRTDSSLSVFAAFCLGGAVVCVPGAVALWRPVTLHAAALLLLVGGLSLAAQMLFTHALRYVPAGSGSTITQLAVAASFGFAALFLGEPLPAGALGGAAVTVAGIVLAARDRPD